MKTKRSVTVREITKGTHCIIVEYVHRKKGQHHWAACFDPSMKTIEQVEEWVTRQPSLLLIDPNYPTT